MLRHLSQAVLVVISISALATAQQQLCVKPGKEKDCGGIGCNWTLTVACDTGWVAAGDNCSGKWSMEWRSVVATCRHYSGCAVGPCGMPVLENVKCTDSAAGSCCNCLDDITDDNGGPTNADYSIWEPVGGANCNCTPIGGEE